MKTSLAMVIALFFFSFSLLLPSFAGQAMAKTTREAAAATDAKPSKTKTGEDAPKKPEYLLPFPGILPDHPLYFFKQIRDTVMDRLIVDPLRKAEFHVLQADKRLNMGIVLIRQEKGKLAIEVISKGEKYLERAASGLMAYKSMGRPVPAALVDKLTKSMEKHAEELTDLASKTSGDVQAGMQGSLEFVRKLQAEIEKLK